MVDITNFENAVKMTDAVLDCIPVVSTVNNVAQAIYKLAHRVDTLNPVAPGHKTSIKIHILSKDNSDFFFNSIPIFGNLMALVDLVRFVLYGFKDDLRNAVMLDNTEIVRLCLGNNALNTPARADEIFAKSTIYSNNETFKLVLNSRDDWSNKTLMRGLGNCWLTVSNNEEERIEKAKDILDYWIDHEKVLDANSHGMHYATDSIGEFLQRGQTDLAGRVIEILPEQVDFFRIRGILLSYSCAQYNPQGQVKETGVLTKEQRDALIAKSTKPSLQDLKAYYESVAHHQLNNCKTADNYRETHFDTLNKLLESAQFQPKEIEEFIAYRFYLDDFIFAKFLVEKYEGQLIHESKAKILEWLVPSGYYVAAHFKQREELFISWVSKWNHDISAHAQELYTKTAERGKIAAQLAKRIEDAQAIQTINDRFKEILLEAFPGCDQAPQAEAV